MPPRLPTAYRNARDASNRMWDRYTQMVDFDPVMAREIGKAAYRIDYLQALLYRTWQARGGQSNDSGAFTLPKQDAITAAINRLDWDSIEYHL